jgi:bacteriorhodopsin
LQVSIVRSFMFAISIGEFRVHLCIRMVYLFGYRFVTTPLLLMDLLLTAGLPWPTILWTIFLDEVMIITGLVGALVKSRYKWGKTHLPSMYHKHTY